MALENVYGWAAFGVIITIMLAIDLGVVNRQSHEIKNSDALKWTGIWLALSLVFAAGIYVWKGPEPCLEFLTGYVVEKSLSLDNIFVFIMVFQYFSIPTFYQQRVLSYGILGAILMRALFIWGGIEILERFTWVFYVLGAFLIITAIKMMRDNEPETTLDNNGLIKFLNRTLPISKILDGQKFITLVNGKRLITPLLLSLIFIELTDVLFALDSVPAIFAITTDPFIIYTSNVFAILGLRSLYFVLQNFIPKFYYLKKGLSLILLFIGVKLVGHHFFIIPLPLSLGFILTVLAGSVILSQRRLKKTSFQKDKEPV